MRVCICVCEGMCMCVSMAMYVFLYGCVAMVPVSFYFGQLSVDIYVHPCMCLYESLSLSLDVAIIWISNVFQRSQGSVVWWWNP